MKLLKPRGVYSLALICLLALLGCGNSEKHFWYPVKLKSVSCAGYSGEVYLMTNSVGWRSWPYYLDPKDMLEIELGTDCVMKTLRKLPEYKRNIMKQLNNEQRKYIIMGF